MYHALPPPHLVIMVVISVLRRKQSAQGRSQPSNLDQSATPGSDNHSHTLPPWVPIATLALVPALAFSFSPSFSLALVLALITTSDHLTSGTYQAL